MGSPSWAAGGLDEIFIHDPYYKGMPGGGAWLAADSTTSTVQEGIECEELS